jgi:hypothetical protein
MKYINLIALIILFLSCGDNNKTETQQPLTKGNRLYSIDITLKNGGDYNEAFTLVQSAGIDFVQLSLQWDELETSPSTYNDTFPDIAEVYYPAAGMKIALNINPIDTTADRRPTDIKSLAWNHATTIQRYKNLIDHLLLKMPSVTFVSFSIGNEIDIYLGSDIAKWTEYTDFFNQTSAYLKTKVASSVFIGTKTTFAAMTSSNITRIQTINTNSTGAFVTYYPMNNDFTVKDPSVVIADFNAITTLYPSKPILFLEAGYQTGTLCNSSEEKQRQFIANIFSAWDAHKESVRAINFVWLHDKSQSEVDTLAAYYGLSDVVFKEYLKTLGVRTNDGTNKSSYTELLHQADVRGW